MWCSWSNGWMLLGAGLWLATIVAAFWFILRATAPAR